MAAAVGGLAIVLHCLELLHFVVVEAEHRDEVGIPTRIQLATVSFAWLKLECSKAKMEM